MHIYIYHILHWYTKYFRFFFSANVIHVNNANIGRLARGLNSLYVGVASSGGYCIGSIKAKNCRFLNGTDYGNKSIDIVKVKILIAGARGKLT